MGLIQRIFQIFEDPTIPIGEKIYRSNTTEFLLPLRYDYPSIEKLLEDERVYSIVVLVASMVKKAYIGPELYPENRYTDDKLDPTEENLMIEMDKFARTMKFDQLCFDYAFQLITHGDLFEEYIKTEEGMTLESIPLNNVRVLADRSQVSTRAQGAIIRREEMISIMMNPNDTNPRILEKGEYLHLSFKNHAVWRKDIVQTDTYGIYSKPPIAPLQRLVQWKEKTIENDIIWKNKLLPRILYKLKMPSIIPSKYTGTPEEKVAKAEADATRLTSSFTQAVKTLRPDDDITVSDAVDASMLEAKSTNYQRPNETIDQINSLINTPQGISSGFLGGEGASAMISELSAIFAGIRIEYIVTKIADGLTDIMKRHARITASGKAKEEVIDRLFIHTDSALTVERFEKMKTAIAMTSTGLYTKGEVRKASGYPRLPQLPQEAFPDEKLIGAKTLGDQVGDVKTEGTQNKENNVSPAARRASTESDQT